MLEHGAVASLSSVFSESDDEDEGSEGVGVKRSSPARASGSRLGVK